MPAKAFLTTKVAGLAILAAAAMLGAGNAQPASGPVPATAPTPDPDSDHAKEIVETACGNCHDIAVVIEARYSKSGWQDVISRMQSYGLSTTTDETKEIVEYLSAKYSES